LFISALSYSNIYYILRKHYSHKNLISILKDLEAIIKTAPVTDQIIHKALHSNFKDFEDAVQYYTAISNKKMEVIVTRNGKDFLNSEIQVLTPDEALKIMQSGNR